jgi:hypothetical protein
MKPEKLPIKGPQGKGTAGADRWPMPEPQERYEEVGGRIDKVDGNFTEDPFTLRAPESDHTPNHTSGPKPSKPEYGKFSTGKVGL